jgi:hypothetical protein
MHGIICITQRTRFDLPHTGTGKMNLQYTIAATVWEYSNHYYYGLSNVISREIIAAAPVQQLFK